MACTVNKKAFCVLEFAKTESIVTVQRKFRIMYRTEPPTDKTIREWYMKFQQSGCLCAAKRRGRPGPLFTVHAIFRHDYPLAVEPTCTPKPLIQKKTLRDSLPIDMLLSAVYVFVVAQSSSEFPEGLMNNPV